MTQARKEVICGRCENWLAEDNQPAGYCTVPLPIWVKARIETDNLIGSRRKQSPPTDTGATRCAVGCAYFGSKDKPQLKNLDLLREKEIDSVIEKYELARSQIAILKRVAKDIGEKLRDE